MFQIFHVSNIPDTSLLKIFPEILKMFPGHIFIFVFSLEQGFWGGGKADTLTNVSGLNELMRTVRRQGSGIREESGSKLRT